MPMLKKTYPEDDGITDNKKVSAEASGLEGKEMNLNEDAGKKSEDPASDEDHISHPRPEAGEEEQINPSKLGKADEEEEEEEDEEKELGKSDENKEEKEGELIGDATSSTSKQVIDAKKSLSVGDLEKAINKLESYANQKPENLKAKLLAKAQRGEDLSKAELVKLNDLLGGVKEEKPELSKSVTSGMAKNKTIQKSLDVSDYLTENNKELVKSLSMLASHVEKSDNRQQEFNILLAKAVADVGKLVKSMADRIEVISKEPVHAPKSQGVNAPKAAPVAVQKEAVPTKLTKSQILDAFDSMVKSTGARDCRVAGEDISSAAAKFESFGAISPTMLRAIEQYCSENMK